MTSYGKIKVGKKTLEDAILDLNTIQKLDRNTYNKNMILRALIDRDIEALRAISNSFYISSGIYQKTCNYFANLYRYDWYIVPEIYDDNMKHDKIIKEFVKILYYLDNSYIKKMCGDIALDVIRNGAYYGYLVEGNNSFQLQELPINYCRSRYQVEGNPAVEFDMRYFDEQFPDTNYRLRVLKLFPEDFSKGYI